MQISFKISHNMAEFRQRCEVGISVANPGPMQSAVLSASNVYHAAMRNRFSGASEGGTIWEPLKPPTVEQHKKVGDYLPHVLHLTGELEQSLKRGEANHVLEITDNSVIEGTEDPKARFHQDGGENLPKRAILVEPETDTLDEMKGSLVYGMNRVVHGDSLSFMSGDELGAMFGVDLI
jgi:hypothetical protein